MMTLVLIKQWLCGLRLLTSSRHFRVLVQNYLYLDLGI